MRSVSVLAACLSVMSAELAAANEAPNRSPLKPKYLIPREIKREVKNPPNAQLPPRDNMYSDFLNNFMQNIDKSNGGQAASASPDVVVVPVTVSIDREGHTHYITGTVPVGVAATTAASVVATTSEAPVHTSAVTPTQAPVSDATSSGSISSESSEEPSTSSSLSSSAPIVDSQSASGSSSSSSSSAGLLGDLGNALSGLVDPSTGSSSTSGTPAQAAQSAVEATPAAAAAQATSAGVGTTGGIPSVVVQPTTSPSSTSSSGLLEGLGGALLGSTGLIPLQAGPTTTATASPSGVVVGASSVIASPSVTPTASASTSDGLDILPTISIPNLLSGLTGDNNSSATATPSPTSPNASPSSPAGSPSSAVAASPTPSGGLLGGLLPTSGGLLGGLLPTSSGGLLGGLLPSSSGAVVSGSGGLLGGLLPTPSSTPSASGLLGGLLPTPLIPISSAAIPKISPSSPGLLPFPKVSSSPLFGSPAPSKSPSSQGIVPPFGVIPTGASTPVSPSKTPITPAAGSSTPVMSSSAVVTPSPKVTPVSTVPETTSTEEPTSSTVVEAPTPTVTEKPTAPIVSIAPTGTDSATTFVPSTIIIVPTSTTSSDSSSTETAASTGIPTTLPQMIAPNGGFTPPPENSTLIQLAFNGDLPYDFVAMTPLSSSQIFMYVPQGLVYALQVPADQISMQSIRPYDSTKTLGYITTLALAYVPSDMVDPLSLELHNPTSRLYSNPDTPVHTIMSMIDSTFPLIPGQALSGSSSTSNNNVANSNSGSGGSNGGSDSGGDDAGASSTSSGVRGSSVGIGVGVVAGAAAYGAAMFAVARRYRKKQQLHRRSSSVADEQMSEAAGTGSAFLSGGRLSPHSVHSGRSGRTQMISAPVMAENSLGWN
ncbi:hypothetical protein DTO021D3_1895 [Paecilomyces variotii]|nr:hypothetical protein DTO032I3_7218 [Paecilomyces variotii]KAJ9281236.1 hypothetical protein DTO021D3_1895 [Paecilomyces variotii]KAJ9344900.1 hypothetical protein DTO027B6_2606 [Paecilomyces variotii]KAJ9383308.1 hypothetical protein DTO032I4_5177 [Paecilomyces variotii]KAJ9410822.1 hypothetical protein DTO045G8_1143 [Paecilomyces variotii]